MAAANSEVISARRVVRALRTAARIVFVYAVWMVVVLFLTGIAPIAKYAVLVALFPLGYLLITWVPRLALAAGALAAACVVLVVMDGHLLASVDGMLWFHRYSRLDWLTVLLGLVVLTVAASVNSFARIGTIASVLLARSPLPMSSLRNIIMACIGVVICTMFETSGLCGVAMFVGMMSAWPITALLINRALRSRQRYSQVSKPLPAPAGFALRQRFRSRASITSPCTTMIARNG